MKDYYKILGGNKDDDRDTLKSYYREIALNNHPDLHPGNKEKEETFKEASKAWAVLENKDTRAKYDATGSIESEVIFGDFNDMMKGFDDVMKDFTDFEGFFENTSGLEDVMKGFDDIFKGGFDDMFKNFNGGMFKDNVDNRSKKEKAWDEIQTKLYDNHLIRVNLKKKKQIKVMTNLLNQNWQKYDQIGTEMKNEWISHFADLYRENIKPGYKRWFSKKKK